MLSAFQNSWSENVKGVRSDLGVRVEGTWGRVQTLGSGSHECGKEDGTIVACIFNVRTVAQ